MKPWNDIFLPMLDALRSGRKVIEISELWGAAKALFLFGLGQQTGRPLVVVTPTEEEAQALLDDLRFFVESGIVAGPAQMDRYRFPAWDVLPFEADSPSSRVVGDRMRFLYGLLSKTRGIFVLPAATLLQKLPPWERFVESVRTVTVGSQADPRDLAAQLTNLGYDSASLVTRVGEFSRRGGIIDFFSPGHDQPVRIEFFGDQIESLRLFDPETQRSIGEITEAVALPARELLVTEDSIGRFLERSGDEALNDQLREGALPPGVEFLAPFFSPLDGIFRYLGDNAIVCMIEPEDCRSVIEAESTKIRSGREEEASEGRLLPEIEELYLSPGEAWSGLAAYPMVNLRLLGLSAERFSMDTKSATWLGVRLAAQPALKQGESGPEQGAIAGLVNRMRDWRRTNRICLVCGTDDAARRMEKLFAEYGLPASRTRPEALDAALPEGPVALATGRLSAGFSWPGLGLILITDEDLFGAKIHRPRPRRSKTAPFLSSFKELKPGDFVVHRDYGVGEYQGLTHLSVDGYETDYLTLRYEPDAKLYVPLYSLDAVQKYIGSESLAPKLDRLGAPAWARTKERIKKDLLEMARDLAAIAATREASLRPPLSAPDTLYREFEAAFPYEETDDQQRAIEDVLADLQKQRPMDRLICGDVGFGKTEVALRAAFKAAEDGLQAAVIVPTTLLADQHHRTFTERLSPFSVNVEMLSRFRTKAEQKETLRGLKAGTVDIVIGTHRLLQKDVAFKNLGLLVIDEEHRFGVRHKERIKELKKLVDVLTLTATPIPRTLHLSLAGLRDLSIIQTPPLDRQSIDVALARFGKRVIREAITRELSRSGQVFFVQNRVQGIERMADFIRGLVPEAKLGIAHGRLAEDEIEAVMSRFIAGDLNVLVTTSIIESGIDIPNANTIIINRADRFGLAELYQIKGRVGRGGQKAYAYLLTPAEEALSDTARKRLRAIQELSELGAGFRIAAQDLESRGAGNMLGKQQSGHIAAVGIDLYTELLEEATAELRGEEHEKERDTQITVKASAFIPQDYIEDMNLRLAAYKELSGAQSEEEVDRIAGDFRDRFGPLPEPAANLIDLMKMKLLAKASGVSRIDAGATLVHITFAEDAAIPADKVMRLLKNNKGKIKLIPEYTLQAALADQSLSAVVGAVKKCLQELR